MGKGFDEYASAYDAWFLDNRNVRAPLVPLDDTEVAALRAGLEASGLL